MKSCVLLLISCGCLWTVEACFFSTKSNDNSNNRNQVPEASKFSALSFPGFLYEPQNFVLSPLSVRNAMAMVSLGATGETAEEIQKLLKFSPDPADLVDNQSQLISSLKRISSGTSVVEFVTADKIYANSGLRVKTQFQKELGLRKMFDVNKADFGGFFEGSGRFFVSKVSQETFIEVNEEGTEAAAATGVEIRSLSYAPTPEFVANRPFLFQIVDNTTKTVLFSGRVKNPLLQ